MADFRQIPVGLGSARPVACPELRLFQVGQDEAAVWCPKSGAIGSLPSQAQAVIPLLDGSRCLDEVSALLARRTPGIRQSVLLRVLIALRQVGMLESSDAGLNRWLDQHPPAQVMPGWLRVLRGLLALRGMVPFPLRCPQPPIAGRSFGLVNALLMLVLFGYAGLWAWLALVHSAGLLHPLLTAKPMPGLLTAALGASAALTCRYLVGAFALRLLGARVQGIGFGISLGIPHLILDLKQVNLLPGARRRTFALATLLGSALVPLLLAGYWLGQGEAWAAAAGVGGHLVVLANFSPLWATDVSLFLAESVGTRRFRHRSAGYLIRKLWADLFARGRLNPDSVAMVIVASLSLAYLLVMVANLAVIAPVALEAALSAAMGSDRGAPLHILTYGVASVVWMGLAGTLLALVSTAAGALWQVASVARPKPRPMTSTEIPALSMAQLLSEVETIPPFNRLHPNLVRNTLAAGRIETFAAGSCIIWPGDPGDCCYLVRSGTCHIEVEDASGQKHTVAVRGPGDLFGETALLTDLPRTAAVVADTRVEVLTIEREALLRAVDAGGYNRLTLTIHLRLHLFLKHHPLLQGLSARELADLADSVSLKRIAAEEVLMEEEEEGNSMFLILSGKLKVERRAVGTIVELGPGDVVGEIALVTGGRRTATVTALEESEVVEVTSDTFKRLLAGHFTSALLLDEEAERRLESLMLV